MANTNNRIRNAATAPDDGNANADGAVSASVPPVMTPAQREMAMIRNVCRLERDRDYERAMNALPSDRTMNRMEYYGLLQVEDMHQFLLQAGLKDSDDNRTDENDRRPSTSHKLLPVTWWNGHSSAIRERLCEIEDIPARDLGCRSEDPLSGRQAYKMWRMLGLDDSANPGPDTGTMLDNPDDGHLLWQGVPAFEAAQFPGLTSIEMDALNIDFNQEPRDNEVEHRHALRLVQRRYQACQEHKAIGIQVYHWSMASPVAHNLFKPRPGAYIPFQHNPARDDAHERGYQRSLAEYQARNPPPATGHDPNGRVTRSAAAAQNARPSRRGRGSSTRNNHNQRQALPDHNANVQENAKRGQTDDGQGSSDDDSADQDSPSPAKRQRKKSPRRRSQDVQDDSESNNSYDSGMSATRTSGAPKSTTSARKRKVVTEDGEDSDESPNASKRNKTQSAADSSHDGPTIPESNSEDGSQGAAVARFPSPLLGAGWDSDNDDDDGSGPAGGQGTTQVVPAADQQTASAASLTVAPASSLTVTPAASQTVAPAASQPVIPVAGPPVAPAVSQPQITAPVASQPVAPAASQTVAAVASQPMAPADDQSVASHANQSVAPVASQTITPAAATTDQQTAAPASNSGPATAASNAKNSRKGSKDDKGKKKSLPKSTTQTQGEDRSSTMAPPKGVARRKATTGSQQVQLNNAVRALVHQRIVNGVIRLDARRQQELEPLLLHAQPTIRNDPRYYRATSTFGDGSMAVELIVHHVLAEMSSASRPRVEMRGDVEREPETFSARTRSGRSGRI